MAGTLLHVTLANEALKDPKISQSTRSSIEACSHEFSLGAVFADLPYYEKILISGIKAVAKLPIHYNVWGTLIHVRSPRGLCLDLLDRATDDWSRAIALGALSHLAVDLVFHEEISRRTSQSADGSKDLDSLHKAIEDEIDLHCHYDLLGHSGIGTSYTYEALNIRPNYGWAREVRRSVAAVHGASPTETIFKKWLRNLRLYGMGSQLKHAPWLKTKPRDDPELRNTSIHLAKRGITLSVRYILAGINYLERGRNLQDFEQKVPDRSMIDGGAADPPRIIHN